MQENVNNNEEKETEAEHNSKEEEEPTTELKLKGQHHLIELRRARVTELWAQGWSQQKIAEQLHVDQTSISLDIKWLKQQAREQIRLFVTEQLPSTVAKAKITLDLITQKLWQTVAQAERDRDEKTKMQALGQIQSAELQKLEIVSNTGIVNEVLNAAEGLQQQQRRQTQEPMSVKNLTHIEELEEEAKENTDNIVVEMEHNKPEDKSLFERKKAIPLHPELEEEDT